jgi:hypothetical protein
MPFLKPLALPLLAFFLFSGAAAAEDVTVSLVMDRSAGPPARIAFAALGRALGQKGIAVEDVPDFAAARGAMVVVAGVGPNASPSFLTLSASLGVQLPTEAECLAVRRGAWRGRQVILAAGGDNLGLAYALYDIADRVGWGGSAADPLAAVRDAAERPHVRDRSVSTYAMQQAYFEQRLFDEDYWRAYFDNLVRNRFNNFSLLFGYESSGFLAPPYAWFFDLPEFPEVKAAGVTAEQQQRYLRALNRVVDLAHERGLHFTLGIWDHIYDGVSSYYTPGVWDHLPAVDGRQPRWPVEGLNAQNLVPYTQAALRRFLILVPNLDGIQFRMHGESGLSKAGLRNFWEPIFQLMAREHPRIRFDARAKEFPRDLIESAVADGVPLRLVTKVLAEQVGLPFHPASVQPRDQFQTRDSYFDLLRYPRIYPMQWREWTSGTMRLLWWGDPDFARRFADSTHLYDGDGFEVAEPLATKMASQPHDLAPIPTLNPPYRFTRYEFERYWPFFQMFGRLGYDPATPPETWDRPFIAHFGAVAGPRLETALHRASWILPRIIEYSLPPDKFPTTRGWPERQRWDDLPVYARAEPADPTLFASFEEEARWRLAGEDTPKVRLEDTGAWFHRTAENVLAEVKAAEDAAGPRPGPEFVCAATDLKILANLAEYHSRRIQSGLAYALFKASNEVGALDDAIAAERSAVAAWSGLVAAAGDVYSDNLALGLPLARNTEAVKEDLSGHWRDEMPRFAAGVAALERERAAFRPLVRRDEGELRPGRGGLASRAAPNGNYEVRVAIAGPAGPMGIVANGINYSEVFTVPAGQRAERTLIAPVVDGKLSVLLQVSADGRAGVSEIRTTRVDPLIAHVPVRRLAPGENLVIRATVAGVGELRGVRLTYGDSRAGFRTVDLQSAGPWVYRAVVPAAELTDGMEYFLEAQDQAGRLGRWPAAGRSSIEITADTQPPRVHHTPVASAAAGQSLRIAAEVTDPAGVKWVRVRYRGVSQYQDYRTLEMLPTGHGHEFAAQIPGDQIGGAFDFMYFIEAMDRVGNGVIAPDMETETPYVVVKLRRDAN